MYVYFFIFITQHRLKKKKNRNVNVSKNSGKVSRCLLSQYGVLQNTGAAVDRLSISGFYRRRFIDFEIDTNEL